MNTQCSLRILIGTDQTQMVTVEVDLKEGDKQPEQHLDDGEHIERVVVPLSELYDKLQGKSPHLTRQCGPKMVTSPQRFRKRMARSSMRGMFTPNLNRHQNLTLKSHRLYHWALGLHWSQRLGIKG